MFVVVGGLVFFAWGEIYSLLPRCVLCYGKKYGTTNAGLFWRPSTLETFDPRVLFLQPSWPLDFANVQPSVFSLHLCYMVARILSAPQ